MKKNIVIVLIIIVVGLIFMIISDNKVSIFSNNIGDEIELENSNYKIIEKGETKFVYDENLLVEQIDLDDRYNRKYKFYYENELLVMTEEYRNNEVYSTRHKKYIDGKVTEEKIMAGKTNVNITDITYENRKRISVVKDFGGEKDITIIADLDDNGNSISSVAKNSNGDILYSYEKKYDGELLIELVNVRSNGYREENFYEYNYNDDLKIQRTTAIDGTIKKYVSHYEYEYDKIKRPLIQRTILLEEL